MDRWLWRGYYEDSFYIEQNSINTKTGRNWSSDDLDLSRLKSIVLEPQSDRFPRVTFCIQSGEVPKRFWRQYRGVTGSRSTTWAFSLTVNGVSFYNFYRPDGSIVLTTNPEGSEFGINDDVFVYRVRNFDMIFLADSDGLSFNRLEDDDDSVLFILKNSNQKIFQIFNNNGITLTTTI